jgi:hypothetical protein
MTGWGWFSNLITFGGGSIFVLESVVVVVL